MILRRRKHAHMGSILTILMAWKLSYEVYVNMGFGILTSTEGIDGERGRRRDVKKISFGLLM